MFSAAKYQVFISSTFEDLKEERDQVIRAVLEMGHIPVGMEMFSAADDEQWSIIARNIDVSDYYAVVSAHRLGSVTSEGMSYTRKEYEYARDKGVPILGFLIDEKAHWPADRVDTKTTTQKALQEFKALIREKPVSFWSNAEDLYGKFSVALMKAITANPREGWVRASSVGSSPEVTSEIIRLSAENAKLRERLEDAKVAADKQHKEELLQTSNILRSTLRTISYRYTSTALDWETTEVSLYSVFLVLGPELMIEASVEYMAEALAMEIREDQDKPWDIVATNQVKELLADFITLDLVQPSVRRHAISDKTEYWSLSSAGIEVLKTIRKTGLAEKPDSKPQTVPAEASNDGKRKDVTKQVE